MHLMCIRLVFVLYVGPMSDAMEKLLPGSFLGSDFGAPGHMTTSPRPYSSEEADDEGGSREIDE